MTDPHARQQWDELLADLGFEPARKAAENQAVPPAAVEPDSPVAETPSQAEDTPPTATAPSVEVSQALEVDQPADTFPLAESATPRRRKTRSQSTKSKSSRRDSSDESSDGASPKPRRRTKVLEPAGEPAEVSQATEPLPASDAASELHQPSSGVSSEPASSAAAESIPEVQPIPVDVPAVNVGEGVLKVVEITETVEITTIEFATRQATSGVSEGAATVLPDSPEKADRPENDKKRKRRRRRGKGRSRDESIAPRTIEAAKGRSVSLEDEDADDEVVGETGGEVVPAVEEDDEVEFIDLSDLQVPSWPELVASLYRPPDR
jgi:hypothetical protein